MADLDVALEAVHRGAAIVREHFGRRIDVDLKAKFNPVTATDREAEKAIVEVLRAETPDYGLLAEEGSGSAAAGVRWIVDPLDGTVNFIHGIPQLGVSIALYDHVTPLLAVTADVMRNEVFVAEAGGGTTLNGRPIAVSQVEDISRAVFATGFPYDHDQHADGLAATIGNVLRRVNGLRRMGSAVLDLAWVAAGRYDGYWEFGLAPWDLAAGILLVREAGGLATEPRGAPSIPEHRLVVAGNPVLHEELRTIVAAGWVPE